MKDERVISNYLRPNKSSMDYVNENKNLDVIDSKDALARMIKAYPNSSDLCNSIGRSMNPSIQVELKFNGAVRNCLYEDALSRGAAPEYEVISKSKISYIATNNEQMLNVKKFTGNKLIMIDMFHVVSFPKLRKDDVYALNVNSIRNCKNETYNDIKAKEEEILFYLYDYAMNDFSKYNPRHSIDINKDYWDNDDFIEAMKVLASEDLEPKILILNREDYYNLYRLSNNMFKIKDDIIKGIPVVRYGELIIAKSQKLEKGTCYITECPEKVGTFPLRYSLDATNNSCPDELSMSIVFDELVGMSIINPEGIVRIQKKKESQKPPKMQRNKEEKI